MMKNRKIDHTDDHYGVIPSLVHRHAPEYVTDFVPHRNRYVEDDIPLYAFARQRGYDGAKSA